jgi:hypothetical protein
MEKRKEEIKRKIEEHEETLRQSKISIILDHYNDIFSDFDPRTYRERSVSHDFLFEAKNAARDKDFETIELSFLVPHKTRDPNAEAIIKRRLREHFKNHHAKLHKEIKAVRRKGIIFAIIGVFFGILATVVSVLSVKEVLRNLLLILFEPAYWFLVWSGLDHIFFYAENKKAELDFYDKMTRTNISFQGY